MATKKQSVNQNFTMEDVLRAGYRIRPAPESTEVATPEPEPSRGALRAVADVGLEAASGAAKGIKFMSDVFGASNPVSQGLQGVSDFAKELQSAQAKGEDQRIAQLMKEAEDKGVGEQVKAALRAAGEAPVRQAIGAIGTSVPMIAASMVPGLREASWGTRAAALGGMGGAQGVGVVKSQMYDSVYQRALEEGRSEQEARALADQAQAYSPENASDIALGGALGAGAALTGFEPAAARAIGRTAANGMQRGLMQSTLRGVAAEALPEAIQGGQEQVAGNRAQQRTGFDTPTFRGAMGSATLEGLLSAPGGAVGGMLDARGAKPAPKLLADQIRATESVPESGPMTRAANQAVEARAQQVELSAAAEGAALAGMEAQSQADLQGLRDFAGVTPNVVASMPMADQPPVAAPSAQPSAEFIDSPFTDRILTVQEMLADPATREKVRERWGDEGLGNIAYYLGVANRGGMPEKTQENLLGMAERLLQEAVLQPIQPAPELGGQRPDPLLLGQASAAVTPAIGMDATPSGRFTVDPQGNVTPESRVQAMDAQRRAEEAASLGKQAPSGQAVEGGTAPAAIVEPQSIGPLGIEMDTSPTGRMLAGQEGVRSEIRMDAINIAQADMQRQAEAAQRAELGLTPDIEAVQQRNAMRPQDGDILNPAGEPFKTRMAVQRSAKKNPGEIVEVTGGFVIRPAATMSTQQEVTGDERGNQAATAAAQGPADGVPAAADREMSAAEAGQGGVLDAVSGQPGATEPAQGDAQGAGEQPVTPLTAQPNVEVPAEAAPTPGAERGVPVAGAAGEPVEAAWVAQQAADTVSAVAGVERFDGAPAAEPTQQVDNQPAAEAAQPQPAAVTITADDVAAAEKQVAQQIADRIDSMKAQEARKIAARYLPTIGVKVPIGKARIKAAMTDAAGVNLLGPAGELGIELSDSVKQALTAKREGRIGMPAAEPVATALPAAQATHQDPGASPEAVTKTVVNASMAKAARNEDAKPSEMRQWLLERIDQELQKAPDRPDYDALVKSMSEKDAVGMFTGSGSFGKAGETGYVSFDVPGDGTFKVRNSVRGLLEFRKRVEASPGFRDRGQQRARNEENQGVQRGSGGLVNAFNNMVEEGDLEVASDYADVVGLELDAKKVAGATKVLKWRESRDAAAEKASIDAAMNQSEVGRLAPTRPDAGRRADEPQTDVGQANANQPEPTPAPKSEAARPVDDKPRLTDAGEELTRGTDKGVAMFSLSPMKSIDANIRRGLKSLAKALDERTTVHRAMYRNGLGWVDFVWGDTGKVKPSGKTKGAMGISHIIEARNRKVGLSDRQTYLLLEGIVDAIGSGKELRRNEFQDSLTVAVEKNGIEALLTKKAGSNAWVVSGWKKKNPVASATGSVASAATSSMSTTAQHGEGAGFSEIVRLAASKVNPSMSLGMRGSGLSNIEVQSIADAIAKRWDNAPEIVVASDMNDAAIPQEVRDYDAKQRSLGAEGEPEGFWYGGKVYLVADAIRSPSDVMRVLFHESLGHYGLRGVFGKALDPILNQIAALRRADVQAKADEYGLDLESPKQRLQAAEEVLAVMAQTKPELGYVKRAISRIRSWLRRTFPKLFGQLKLTDAEIIRDYILPARGWVERGPGGGPKGGLPAMSRSQEQAAADETARFSRTAAAKAYVAPAMDRLNETFNHPGKLSWWHKTVGSMYNLAERMPAFKPVYDAAQSFINDVSFYAIEAADKAPKLLPRLENWSDLAKSPITAQDNKAVAAPVFEGTLSWRRDELGKPVLVEDLAKRYASLTPEQKAQRLLRANAIGENVLKMWQGMPQAQYESSVNTAFEGRMLKAGIVFAPDELKSIFKLNDAQVALYQEFRQSIDASLDNMGKSDLLRVAGKDAVDLKDAVMSAPDVDAAAVLLRDHLLDLAKESPDRSDALTTTANDMITRAEKVQRLKMEGYAPLSRFGQYTVDVVVDGERQYFSMFETARDANRMAAKLRMEYGVENVAQGTLSQREFEMLQGITPESLELFGNMLGLDSTGNQAQDQVFQEYLKRTKANRSAMKRLIHRKGIAGYSEDVGRVLAAFVYSNARQTSAALHMGDLGEAVMAIPKGEGELKDAAVELARYVKEPREEAAKMRGWLFAQYLGGSIASAIVNFTQPLTTSAPYLSQFGGMGKSVKALYQAMADLKDKQFEAGLAESFRKRTEDGTLAPQGVHELMAQSRGEATLRTGDGTQVGDTLAKGRNALSKTMIGWGKLFGIAEQINRQSTYVAAYRMGVERGMADPDAFAKKVVDETQFVNNKANKMKFGRGAIGATLMTFKSYSLNWLELFHRLATQNGREGKMAAAWMVGVLLLSAGASGLPFAEDGEDLADFLAQRLGYNWSSKKARQEFLENLFGGPVAGLVENGVTGLPGSPIDVSGRLGMSNLIPGTGLLLKKKDHTSDFTEVLGPAGDLAKRTFQAGDLLLSGNVGQAALTIAPKAIGNLEKGVDMAATGLYRDARGYKVDDATTGEAIGKAIGFQPRSVAQIQEASGLNQRAKDFYRLKVEGINAKWAKAIFEKDSAAVDEVRAELKRWNRQNPDQRIQANIPAILRRVKEMRKPKADRIADTAPKAMRASMREEVRKMQEEMKAN